MNKPKAVIFDADGTLLDSFELITEAYQHIAKTHNLHLPDPDEVRSHMGKSLPAIAEALFPGADVQELLNTNSAFMAANAMKSEAFEGVHELLDDLTKHGLKLAILTSGGARIIEILKHHNLDGYFDSVVHHERITHAKPDPEGFILACEEIGVKPNEAVMVGDTLVDIQTGINSKAFATIAVTHGYGLPQDLHDSAADYVVESIEGIKQVIKELLVTV